MTIIIGIIIVTFAACFAWHQRQLRQRARLMQEAIRNRDFTFRLSTRGLLSGERAMQRTLNKLSEAVREQMNQTEVEAWERLTRMLTHEMRNGTTPITSISQSLLRRSDVIGTPLEDGIQAIYDSSQHLSEFVENYRKMAQLDQPVMNKINLREIIDSVILAYPQLSWQVKVPTDIMVHADSGMLRQVLANLIKNAMEADAKTIVIEVETAQQQKAAVKTAKIITLLIGNDGLPIPPEDRQSLFVPFFTTKQSGSGIGLSLSRRMMVQQGGMLQLADMIPPNSTVAFLMTIAPA